MRIKQTARFPHPILSRATDDYQSKQFELLMEVLEDAAAGQVIISGSMVLDDEDITGMIDDGRAVAGLMLHCQGTYVDQFIKQNLGNIELDLSGGTVRGAVHVRGVVLAAQDSIKLQSKAINPEFPEHSLLVNSGDLIAMTDELSFEAGLEKLAPMESIFKLRIHDEIPEGTFKLDLGGESIDILVPPSLHGFLGLLRDRPSKDVLLSSLYLPVIMSVLNEMAEGSDNAERRWYGIMEARCRSVGIDIGDVDLATDAQTLLESPLGSLQGVFQRMEAV